MGGGEMVSHMTQCSGYGMLTEQCRKYKTQSFKEVKEQRWSSGETPCLDSVIKVRSLSPCLLTRGNLLTEPP